MNFVKFIIQKRRNNISDIVHDFLVFRLINFVKLKWWFKNHSDELYIKYFEKLIIYMLIFKNETISQFCFYIKVAFSIFEYLTMIFSFPNISWINDFLAQMTWCFIYIYDSWYLRSYDFKKKLIFIYLHHQMLIQFLSCRIFFNISSISKYSDRFIQI